MGDIIRAIDESFQRLLRWVYPGFLILVLLYMSKPCYFKFFISNQYMGSAGIIIGCLTLGVLAYIIQYSIIAQILNFISKACMWDPNLGRWPDDNMISSCAIGKSRVRCKRIAKCFDMQAGPIEREIQKEQDKQDKYRNGNSSLMDYRWAIYHATSLSGLLIFVFWCIRSEHSILNQMNFWPILTAIILFIFSVLYYMLLSRVKYP